VTTAPERPTFTLDQLPGRVVGRPGLTGQQLLDCLLADGLAQRNGSAGSYELTAGGAEAAAGVEQLREWIRA